MTHNELTELENSKVLNQEAKALLKATMLPPVYRNEGNMMVATHLAQKLNTDIYSIVQSLNIIQGKPSFGSQFIASVINSCGKFEPLEYVYVDENEEEIPAFKKNVYGCYVKAKEKESGKERYSILITMDMAKQEGWLSKNGSKWKTMPAIMLSYRAVAFFGRQHLPEYLNGIYATEELVQFKESKTPDKSEADALNEAFINSDDYEIINEGE